MTYFHLYHSDNLTNDGMLDAMLLDRSAHRLKWRRYQSNLTEYERWQKWLTEK